MKAVLTQTYDVVKNLDCFGQQVTFQINGNKRFKTLPGAMCTLLCLLIVVAFTLYQFYLLAMCKDT